MGEREEHFVLLQGQFIFLLFHLCKTPFRCAMMDKVRKKNVRNEFRAWEKCCEGESETWLRRSKF